MTTLIFQNIDSIEQLLKFITLEELNKVSISKLNMIFQSIAQVSKMLQEGVTFDSLINLSWHDCELVLKKTESDKAIELIEQLPEHSSVHCENERINKP